MVEARSVNVKNTTTTTVRTSLLPVALCVRFVALRDAETRRAWQQQQTNVNAAAEAAALRAMHKESTRLAGEHKGGRVTSNFYLAKIKVQLSVFVRKVYSEELLCY